MLALLMTVVLVAEPSESLARGKALAESGELKAAIEELRQVTDAYPTWALAQLELADALIRDGSDDAACEKAAAAARAIEPSNPRAWLLSAKLQEQRGDMASATESYSHAVALRPDLAEAHERLGALLVEADRPAEAVAHLWYAIAAQPDSRIARANLADACERIGDAPCAEEQLRALVAAAPRNLAYRRRLVDFLERTGQAAKAREASRGDAQRPPGRHLRPLQPSSR